MKKASPISTGSDSSPEFETPMMKQYLKLKAKYADCLLFFRLGDFYELFLDDAKTGAEILGITLTARARGKDGKIPMAGVPYHAADNYVAKLTDAGHKVAICEQVSLPNGKGLVDRKVVRIITPGTTFNQNSLKAKSANFVVTLHYQDHTLGVAAADVSTGSFLAGEIEAETTEDLTAILNQLQAQLQPTEWVISPPNPGTETKLDQALKQANFELILPFHDWDLHLRKAKQNLKNQFGSPQLKQADFLTSDASKNAAAALLGYLYYTHHQIKHVAYIRPLFENNYLHLDHTTVTNLEILETLRDHTKAGSLLHTLDYTHTSMGGRLLKNWLLKPLISLKEIEKRQDVVEYWTQNLEDRSQLQQHISTIGDLERLSSRIAVGLGGPRDLWHLALGLEAIQELSSLLKTSDAPPLLKQLRTKTSNNQLQILSAKLLEHLKDDPPVDPKNGGFIRQGIDKNIDKLNQTISTNREWLIELEKQERKRTGISSLKVKFNKVFGFYIEISKSNLHLVPDDYFRKQTLVNAERFMTPAMKERESIILTAEEDIKEREFKVYETLAQETINLASAIQDLSLAVAEIDCLLSLSQAAVEHHYHRPQLINKRQINLIQSRHPVIENLLYRRQFVPNDIQLNTKNRQVLLITGPNMAGKSVIMRQVALITLMAHLGSFVPAEKAVIGLTDRIFVRSGAADMITAGLSTFMVEMIETAAILNQTTDRSLVIMDEIGRGTSTYDGISLAWAIAEFLVSKESHQPLTLFATHYHELQALADRHPKAIANVHLAIAGHQQKPVFLYQLKDGPSEHSYGIAVARLAGLPPAVLNQAEKLLKILEKEKSSNTDSIPKFDSKNQKKKDVEVKNPNAPVLEELAKLNLNSITPLEALQRLATLQKDLVN